MNCAVLLIEDEEVLARNIQLYLERYGFEVRLAHSAEAGLLALDDMRPDVVVLDFNLPGADGLDALARIRQRAPDAVVVMTTGHGSEQVAVDAMKRGAYDYLTKPVSLGKLKLVIERALQEVRREGELSYYRRREADENGLGALIGESEPMQRLRAMILRVVDAERAMADGVAPAVLIQGETGTGKELVARALHLEGPRRDAPFVEINCATLPAQLLEAELFGYERGAFTDAKERKLGLIESAEGGTLFLDEVGEMDLGLQSKLLKLLEDRKVRRLGSVREQVVSVRILAATNRDLEAAVREGRFRSDLFFRLRILQVRTTPLRERGDDAVLLARHFLERMRQRYGKPRLAFSPQALAALRDHDWPGNVRELRNVVEQCAIMAHSDVIEPELLALSRFDAPASGAAHAPAGADDAGAITGTLPEIERRMLVKALEASRWNVTRAARELGISRDTLRYRIEKFGLRQSD
ncbi:MAG: sigma-54 dependent transcriptional regulator [Burkholderiaceae bacterium]